MQSVINQKTFKSKTILLLKSIGKISEKNGYHACLVGGPVRDILLGKRPKDLDITVEGMREKSRMKKLAEKIVGAHGALLEKFHPEFGTASMNIGGMRVDLAVSRRETYSKPGALPDVFPGGIAGDLERRDFSINAMAVRLDNRRFGELFDPLGGLKDLKDRSVKILHPGSFIDDPTRILRALRFCARFGFTLEKNTRRLLEKAVRSGYLNNVSRERLTAEFLAALKEENSFKCLKKFHEYGVSFAPEKNLALINNYLYNGHAEKMPSALKLALLFYGFNLSQVRARVAALKLPRELSGEIITVYRFVNGEVIRRLPKWAEFFLEAAGFKRSTPLVTGKDLIKLGYKPGPLFRKILFAVNTSRKLRNFSEAKKYIAKKFRKA